MPVEGGAGRILMETGTPLCSPTPEAPTGFPTVVSNRIVTLHRGLAARSFLDDSAPSRPF
jgi:hypothetical protein